MPISMKLPSELSDALRSENNRPVTVEDEETHRVYVLMPIDVYQRVQSVFVDEFSISDTYAAQSAAAGAAGWDDPEMDIYNELVERS